MRGKRAKQYRKLMKQYALTFGFREPYQVLVDAQMILDTARFTMSLAPALTRTLSGAVKPMITQCSIRHLYTLPQSHPQSPHRAALIEVAKSLERRRCGHHILEQPLSEEQCLMSVIDPKHEDKQEKDLVNRFNYVVACQDEGLRRWCRGVKGTPLVYVKRSVMVMEPMAERSKGIQEGMERGKFRVGLKGKEALGKRKIEGQEVDGLAGAKDEVQEGNEGEEALQEGPSQVKKRKTRGPKQPNPLSMKKAKGNPEERNAGLPQGKEVQFAQKSDELADASQEGGETSGSSRRKRKHRSKKSEGVVLEQTASGGETELV